MLSLAFEENNTIVGDDSGPPLPTKQELCDMLQEVMVLSRTPDNQREFAPEQAGNSTFTVMDH